MHAVLDGGEARLVGERVGPVDDGAVGLGAPRVLEVLSAREALDDRDEFKVKSGRRR